MREAQQRVGVRVHRAADVDEQHDAARPGPGPVPAQLGRLAARLEQRAQRAARVDGAARGRPPATGGPRLPRQAQQRQQAVELGALVRREAGDVAVPQLLDAARGRGAVHLLLGALVRRVAGAPGVLHHPQRRPAQPRAPDQRAGPVAEVRAERRVVPGQVVLAGAQGQPAGPVDVVAAAGVERGDRLHRGLHALRRGAATPAARSVRPRPTMLSDRVVRPVPRDRRSGRERHGDHLADVQPGRPLLVLAVLQHRTERRRRGVGVQPRRAEGDERLRPVDASRRRPAA